MTIWETILFSIYPQALPLRRTNYTILCQITKTLNHSDRPIFLSPLCLWWSECRCLLQISPLVNWFERQLEISQNVQVTYSSLTTTVMFSLNPKNECQKIIQSALDTAESGLNLLLQWTKTTDLNNFTKKTTTTLQTFLTTVQTTRFLRLILAKTSFTGTRPNCTNPTYGNTISQLPHMYVYTLQTQLNYLFSAFELGPSDKEIIKLAH